MANTLTNLTPALYAALDVVSRELVGFIPSVNRDPRADRVAKNQTLYSHVAPANTLADITPAMTVTAATDQTIGTKSLTISNYKVSGFNWTGEEQMSVDAGPGFANILQDQIEQAVRAVVNQMETDVASAATLGASRAFGTSGTTPFATTLTDPANIKKILDDNGAPMGNRSLVINTTSGAALRTLAQLTKANEAADSTLLRQGTLLDIHGMAIRESAQVPTSTAGTAASATVSNAGYAAGATTLTLTAAGTGTILAGDVITIARQTGDDGVTLHKFVVLTGNADVSAGGTIVIAAPGLKKQLTTSTAAIVVSATGARNCGFSRNAILLATRLPAVPTSGDQATDRMTITDPRSGISFEVSLYPGYRMVKYEIAAAWGVTVVKPEHVALLLG